MRAPARSLAIAITLAAFAARGARAADPVRIDVTDATLRTGVATQPGVVTIDGAAPAAPAPVAPTPAVPGPLAGPTANMPAAPATAGGVTDFVASGPTFLSAGSYAFRSMTVPAGSELLIGGRASIAVAGDVTIEGRMILAGVGASELTIASGGTIRLTGGDPDGCGLLSSGDGTGAVTLDAAGALEMSATDPGQFPVRLELPLRDIRLRARGPAGARIVGVTLSCGAAGMSIDASQLVLTDSAVGDPESVVAVRTHAGPAVLGDVALQGRTLRVESAAELTCDAVHAAAMAGDLALVAAGGDARLRDSSLQILTGPQTRLELRAARSVFLGDACVLEQNAGGTLAVSAHGGDVIVGETDSDVESLVVGPAGARVELRSTGTTALRGRGRVDSPDGLSIDAGADVQVADTATLSAGGGALAIRAGGALAIASELGGDRSRFLSLEASAAGTGASAIRFASAATEGSVSVLAGGDLRVQGSVTSGTSASFVSRTGTVDVSGAVIRTAGEAFGASSPIDIASYGGDAGRIDARGATLVTGDAGSRSGDVRLVVRGVDPTVAGVLVPTLANVRRLRDDRSRLDVRGFLDIAAAGAFPGGPVTLRCGARTIPVPASATAGARRVYRADGVTVEITTPRKGGSRHGFRIRLAGAPDEFASSPAAPLELGLDLTGIRSAARFVLDRGRTLRRDRGSVLTPELSVLAASVTVRPGARSVAAFTLRVPSLGDTAAHATDVRVEALGFRADVPAAAFGPYRSGRFVADAPVAGVESVTVDVAQRTVSFTLRGIDVGAIAARGDVPATVAVRTDAVDASASIRMGRRGPRLSY